MHLTQYSQFKELKSLEPSQVTQCYKSQPDSLKNVPYVQKQKKLQKYV